MFSVFLSFNFYIVNAQDGKISLEEARIILNKIGYQITENNSGIELENGINKFKRLTVFIVTMLINIMIGIVYLIIGLVR